MKALGTLILAGMLSILPGVTLLWAGQSNLILADDSNSTAISSVQSSSDNSSNTAEAGGGILAQPSSDACVFACDMHGNTAGGNGVLQNNTPGEFSLVRTTQASAIMHF